MLGGGIILFCFDGNEWGPIFEKTACFTQVFVWIIFVFFPLETFLQTAQVGFLTLFFHRYFGLHVNEHLLAVDDVLRAVAARTA